MTTETKKTFRVYHQHGMHCDIVATFDNHDDAIAECERLNAEEKESNSGDSYGHFYTTDAATFAELIREWSATPNAPGHLTWKEWEARGVSEDELRQCCTAESRLRTDPAWSGFNDGDLLTDEQAEALWARLDELWAEDAERLVRESATDRKD